MNASHPRQFLNPNEQGPLLPTAKRRTFSHETLQTSGIGLPSQHRPLSAFLSASRLPRSRLFTVHVVLIVIPAVGVAFADVVSLLRRLQPQPIHS